MAVPVRGSARVDHRDVVLFWMTDRPAEARWLNAEEKGWLTEVMDKERPRVGQSQHFGAEDDVQPAGASHRGDPFRPGRGQRGLAVFLR